MISQSSSCSSSVSSSLSLTSSASTGFLSVGPSLASPPPDLSQSTSFLGGRRWGIHSSVPVSLDRGDVVRVSLSPVLLRSDQIFVEKSNVYAYVRSVHTQKKVSSRKKEERNPIHLLSLGILTRTTSVPSTTTATSTSHGGSLLSFFLRLLLGSRTQEYPGRQLCPLHLC